MHTSSSTFSLTRFVEEVRVVAPAAGGARRVDRLPDGRTMLVVRILDRDRRGDVMVVGPRSRALLKDAGSFVSAVSLQFKPGWSTALLGVSASTLTDAYVSLDDLWGRSGRDLTLGILAANSVPEMLDRIALAFASRVREVVEPASARLARHAVRLMESEETRVESVADRLGVTARHLRRAFAENIGVAPKDYARAVRLQRAVKMTATSVDWADIAASAGYYDQSHLIADFRDLVGLTPRAFWRRATAPEDDRGASLVEAQRRSLHASSKLQPRWADEHRTRAL